MVERTRRGVLELRGNPVSFKVGRIGFTRRPLTRCTRFAARRHPALANQCYGCVRLVNRSSNLIRKVIAWPSLIYVDDHAHELHSPFDLSLQKECDGGCVLTSIAHEENEWLHGRSWLGVRLPYLTEHGQVKRR